MIRYTSKSGYCIVVNEDWENPEFVTELDLKTEIFLTEQSKQLWKDMITSRKISIYNSGGSICSVYFRDEVEMDFLINLSAKEENLAVSRMKFNKVPPMMEPIKGYLSVDIAEDIEKRMCGIHERRFDHRLRVNTIKELVQEHIRKMEFLEDDQVVYSWTTGAVRPSIHSTVLTDTVEILTRKDQGRMATMVGVGYINIGTPAPYVTQTNKNSQYIISCTANNASAKKLVWFRAMDPNLLPSEQLALMELAHQKPEKYSKKRKNVIEY